VLFFVQLDQDLQQFFDPKAAVHRAALFLFAVFLQLDQDLQQFVEELQQAVASQQQQQQQDAGNEACASEQGGSSSSSSTKPLRRYVARAESAGMYKVAVAYKGTVHECITACTYNAMIRICCHSLSSQTVLHWQQLPKPATCRHHIMFMFRLSLQLCESTSCCGLCSC
jgi:hypothetical protein